MLDDGQTIGFVENRSEIFECPIFDGRDRRYIDVLIVVILHLDVHAES